MFSTCSVVISYFCIPAWLTTSVSVRQDLSTRLIFRRTHSLFGILFPEPTACWGCSHPPYTQCFGSRCCFVLIAYWALCWCYIYATGRIWSSATGLSSWHVLALWAHVLEFRCPLLRHQAMLSDFIWHFNGSQLHKRNSQLRTSIQRMPSQWIKWL